jgi:hypothetical protein
MSIRTRLENRQRAAPLGILKPGDVGHSLFVDTIFLEILFSEFTH